VAIYVESLHLVVIFIAKTASDIVTLTPLFAFQMSISRRFSDAYANGFRRSHTSMMSEFKGHPTMYTIMRAFC
jgi:hypothetical protein